MERALPDGALNVSWGPSTGEATAPGFSAAWTVVLAVLMALLIVATVVGNALVMLAFVVDSSLRTQNNFFLLNLAISDFLVAYRAQQGNTRRAVQKMVLVWVLAFLLYGPAILSWEYLSGGSIIPEGECYAEFFYNWYFLITASTLEFFTPFLSVTFFNLSIYLNIQKRTRDRLDVGREEPGRLFNHESETNPKFSLKCWEWEQKMPRETLNLHKYEAHPSDKPDGARDSPTSSSNSSTHASEKPRSLKRSYKPSASTSSLEKRMKMMSQSITQRFRLSRDKKVAKSLAVIVSIFGLCWAPYTLLMIIRAACHGRCIPDYWYETSFWLLWVNSAVNPILYPLCHYSFRRAFMKLLCPKKLKIQPHNSLEHGWK